MAGRPQQKLKLLYIQKILSEHSDEQHPLSSGEIINALAGYGIQTERKSIYSDIDTLRDFGVDIIKTKTPKSGYFIGSRKFQASEIRMFIDAIRTAPFITPSKTNDLIKKLESELSLYQAASIASQTHSFNVTKTENSEVYYNIDTIQHAIAEKSKIRFFYYHRQIVNNMPVNNAGKEFVFSPYALMWDSDRYYMVGNYDKYDNLSHYRVDRMKKVEIIQNSTARPFSEVCEYTHTFNTADYSKKVFKMYSGGNEISFVLLCDNDMLEPIIDRFGKQMPFHTVDSGHFKVTVRGQISEGLISWLMEVGEKVRVVSPDSLVELLKKRISSIAQNYNMAAQ